MASTGFDRTSGAVTSGFDHVRQSIGVILTTPVGSRVMRRDFGSEVPDLIDRPLTDQVILAIYAAAVTALARWEPRYSVSHCVVSGADADGRVSIELEGIYRPRGHLGDPAPAPGRERAVIFLTRPR